MSRGICNATLLAGTGFGLRAVAALTAVPVPVLVRAASLGELSPHATSVPSTTTTAATRIGREILSACFRMRLPPTHQRRPKGTMGVGCSSGANGFVEPSVSLVGGSDRNFNLLELIATAPFAAAAWHHDIPTTKMTASMPSN
jgi:hypothetical protein